MSWMLWFRWSDRTIESYVVCISRCLMGWESAQVDHQYHLQSHLLSCHIQSRGQLRLCLIRPTSALFHCPRKCMHVTMSIVSETKICVNSCSPHLSKTRLLTLSPPIPLRLYTLPYWSNPPVLFFDIRALWRSAPECPNFKKSGLDQYGT